MKGTSQVFGAIYTATHALLFSIIDLEIFYRRLLLTRTWLCVKFVSFGYQEKRLIQPKM